MNILFLTVLFSSKPEDCETVRSLANLNFEKYGVRPSFIFWDNSSDGFGHDELDSKFLGFEVIYKHTPENIRLSKLYNNVIDAYSGAYDYIVFLDDDSVVLDEYLHSLLPFFVSCALLAMPKIFFEGVMISPGLVRGVRGKLYDEAILKTGLSDSLNVVGMMSGTIAKTKLFEFDLRFCERLSFYGVDTRFYLDYQKNFKELFVLDLTMEHSSALRDSAICFDDQIKRFSNLMVSRFIVFEKVKYNRFKIFWFFAGFIIMKCWRLKSLRYLLLFKNYKYFIYKV